MPLQRVPPAPVRREKVPHQKYHVDRDGVKVEVPGVTTVLGELNKPALMRWAFRIGRQGDDIDVVRDEAARSGTLAHRMVECFFSGAEVSTEGFSRKEVRNAHYSFYNFTTWMEQHEVEPLLQEAQLVSEEHGFGGTLDWYGRVDGVLELLDFKTGERVYPEYFIQLAAYRQLLVENGHEVQAVRVVPLARRPRKDGADVGDVQLVDTTKHLDIFLHALRIHELRKTI